MSRLPSAAVLATLLAVAPSAAQVRLEVGPGGGKVIHNRGSRSRPASAARPLTAAPAIVARASIEEVVTANAGRSGLDPELVYAVIQVESSFNPLALSSKGAMGLMQLMPETAEDLAVTDPYDVRQNVRGGCSYLQQMLDTFGGNVELALAGYNAGPQAVRRFGGIPPYRETREYVERVLRIYRGDESYTLAGSSNLRIGRPTYVTRDAQGRIMITTQPPRR